MIDLLKKLSTVQLLILSIFLSVILTGIIVSGMEMLLKDEVTYDYLLTGFVASLFVAGLVVGFLTFCLNQIRNSESDLRIAATIFESKVASQPGFY